MPDKPSLHWVSHPARLSARKLALLLVVVGATAVAVGLNTGSAAWSVLAAAVLLLSVHDFLLPTAYRLTADGVESRSLLRRRRKPWAALHSAHRDRHGVLLSPFSGPSRLEAFRGLYVRFHDNDNDVLAFVQAHVGGTA